MPKSTFDFPPHSPIHHVVEVCTHAKRQVGIMPMRIRPYGYLSVAILFTLFSVAQLANLVVEQADVLLNEGNAQLLGCLEDGLVVLAAAGSSNVLGS